MVLRKGSTSEVDSGIEREKAPVVETLPQIATDEKGGTLAAKEVVILITLTKKQGGTSNVTIRGIGENSLRLRPQIRLVQGRMPRFGVTEMVAGSSLARRFRGLEVGSSLGGGLKEWRIVGIMDAGNTAFSSEIWADGEQVMQSFRRPVYSSLIFKLTDTARFDAVKKLIEDDPRLSLQAKRETRFYLDQSEMMAKFLRILGCLAHGYLLAGCNYRRHDHHVCSSCQPYRRDRDAAGPGLPAPVHPGELSHGVAFSRA